ncbi:MAG TPA: TIGR03885 family FMN-dependent LLM class oxidoreductase [Thermoanaerobaculia bacterium]
MKIGVHASHEQYSPRTLIDHVMKAEAAGFEAAMCSDHLMPWSERQGHSGFAWSWLGAAMQATSLPYGVVNAPGWRYHPVIIAQAAATLQQMFPDRFWIAVGSGEALNEHITGEAWAPKHERNERLLECVTVMRRLWQGETVTHRGHVEVVDARVWSLPERPPRVVGAAITEATAEWMGGWADALITVSAARDRMKRVLDAFRRGGGDGKPILLQAKLSWAPTEREAIDGAMDQWSTNVFNSSIAADLSRPDQFEALSRFVNEEQLRDAVRISSDLDQHIEWIRQDRELGIDELYLHNVNLEQQRFIEAFGRHVLSALR